MNSQILARAERIEKSLGALASEGADLAEALRPLIADARSLRKDLITILELVKSQIEAERPVIHKELERLVYEEMTGLTNVLGRFQETINKQMHERFDRLMEVLDSADPKTGRTLEATINEIKIMRTFAGDPITAAAELIRADEEVVVDGVTYVVGANVTRVGQFLYLNRSDGKLYPMPIKAE